MEVLDFVARWEFHHHSRNRCSELCGFTHACASGTRKCRFTMWFSPHDVRRYMNMKLRMLIRRFVQGLRRNRRISVIRVSRQPLGVATHMRAF